MMEEAELKEERISKVRDIKSEHILDAALEVFSKKGIYEARLEDIAAEAGFSKASLYNYYPNKEAIILSLTTREWFGFIDALNNSQEHGISQDLPFSENMRRYLHLSFKIFGKHFHFIANINFLKFINATSENESLIGKLTELRKYRYQNGILKVVKWAKEKNEIVSEIPDLSLCRFVDAAIIGTYHDWIHEKKIGDIEKTTDNLCKLLMNGMKG